MPTLRTARVRRALSDPNRAPPGTTAPTFGAGLTVTGDAVVAVDFGAGAAQVPTGTKVPGTIPVDTRGATDGDALRYDAGEGAFVPSADASLNRPRVSCGASSWSLEARANQSRVSASWPARHQPGGFCISAMHRGHESGRDKARHRGG